MEDKFALARKKLGYIDDPKAGKKGTANTMSIIIDGDLHKNYKDHCRYKKKKIGGQTEDLIRLYLSKPDEIQRLINEMEVTKG